MVFCAKGSIPQNCPSRLLSFDVSRPHFILKSPQIASTWLQFILKSPQIASTWPHFILKSPQIASTWPHFILKSPQIASTWSQFIPLWRPVMVRYTP
jgi:hypothetical protein